MGENTISGNVTIPENAGPMVLVGRYRVVRQLGQGGMGSVWLAEDTKLDGRKVAIKMLPSILVSNKRAYAQVKQEALVSLKLLHPNIVPVRAFEEDNGNPFLVMDYIDGQTLDDYLAEKGKLTEEETIRLLKPVAEALDYAHTQGVVHRDVKPGNVIICKDGTPFVLDFGIAREVQETMTRVTGKLSSGTLLYMSPEQLNGDAPKPAQDIYSFAAMTYECLKGEQPFVRGGIEDQIKNKIPEPFPGNIAICPSVMAGLAKTPKARPPTCAAVLAGTKARGADGGASADRTRIGFVAAGLLVLAGIGAAVWFSARARIPVAPPANPSVLAAPIERPAPAMPSVKTQIVEKVVERVVEKPVVTQVVEKVTPVDPVRTDDDSDRRRQEEVAKLAKTRTRISIKVSAAKDDYAKVAPYRSEREGFESHLTEIDRQWETVEGVQNPKTLADAEKTFAAVSEAADAIAFELNWLATNRDGRDAAKRIEKEIIDELEPKLREFRADDVAKSKYGKGQGERQAGAQALARGEFASARRQYETAKATLAAALADARQFHVKTALSVATEYKAAAQWQNCIGEAEKVLGWEPTNADALALKREAEGHLVPTLRFVAKIGDREVPATAMFDGKSCTSPWRLEENVKPDSRIPSSDVAVEYAEGGKRYVGTIKPVTVDWKGPKTVVVALTEYKGPKPGDTKTITLPGGATMEMVWCPPGSFMMGSPQSEDQRDNDEVQHRVTLTEGFWMGKYEVTQRQWESVMGENPSSFKGMDRPVERVSWDDCQHFIQKINAAGQVTVSLPTEAQWEYACRAGTTTPFSFGTSLNGDKANCNGNYPCGTTAKGRYRTETAPVGSYAPNAWGLYDMHGNVWEWCEDWYGDYPTGSVTDPTGSASGTNRVLCGGCWFNPAWLCRSAYRGRDGPGDRGNYLGFRLVCSAGPRR